MKKVLIITYYWPPSGGIGVHRCLKFAKYLRSFGWEPVVYAPKNAQYPYLDPDNEKDIPQGMTVIRRPIREPFALFKFLSGRKKSDAMSNPVHVRHKKSRWIDNFAIWVRGNFFIPDARALWIRPSVRFLRRYLAQNPVNALLTDGPPHTNTVIAAKLKKHTQTPWLADFQDPWTQVDYYKLLKLTPWANRKHQRLEQETFSLADKITIASPTWKEDLKKIGAKNVDVIFWGYDEDDFKEIEPQPDKKFTILHAGLLGYDRNPETFFRVLADLKNEIQGFEQDLVLKLPGMIDFSVKEAIETHKLSPQTHLPGSIPRRKVLQQTLNAQILLLPLNKADNAQGRIPGKLFECLRAARPILCLGPQNSDVAQILKKTGNGETFGYDHYQSIKNFVKTKYQQFKTNGIPNSQARISEYSVKNQVAKIANYLDQIEA